MPTLVTLWPCEAQFAQAAEGAPLAMTATPLAAGGELLRVGAMTINKRAGRNGVERFSWGAEVIELNGRWGVEEKHKQERKVKCRRVSVL